MHIELLKPHEHAGIERNPGEIIDLAEDSAQWLCEIGSARPATDSVSPAKPSKRSNFTQE